MFENLFTMYKQKTQKIHKFVEIIDYLYEQISSAVISYKTHWNSDRKKNTFGIHFNFLFRVEYEKCKDFFLLSFLHFNNKIKNKKYDIKYNSILLYGLSQWQLF